MVEAGRRLADWALKKRAVLCSVLAFALAFGLVPIAAFADETSPDAVAISPIEAPHVTDEVIVVCERSEATTRSATTDGESQIESLGYEITDRLSENASAGETAVVANLPDDKDVESAIVELENTAGVAYVQPNYEYGLLEDVMEAESADAPFDSASENEDASLFAKPNDPYCVSSGAQNQWYLWSSGVVGAWDQARSSRSVTVAVLDTGCRLDHEDLAGSVLASLAWDTFENKPLASSPVGMEAGKGDAQGHGTHVSGIVAASADNGKGIAGASYNANVLPIKVFDNEAGNPKARTADIIEAYDYLVKLMDDGSLDNLRVVNMSLGYYSSGASDTDKLLEQRIKSLRDRGVLTVCAGGNGDAYGRPRTDKSLPSDFDACLAVTSLNSDGSNSYWSDYNRYKDISAPGVSMYSAINSSSNAYGVKNGTSAASPVVAGVACLLWAANPALTVDEVVGALLDNAAPIHDAANDRTATSGSKGALDAAASVRAVVGAESTPKPVPEPSQSPGVVGRLAGATALGTMTAITSQGFASGSCDSVVVATMGGYWDALTASALAGLEGCPVLITDGDALSVETASEVRRLGARTVYIAGGPAAVSNGVQAQLSAIAGVTKTVRLAGDIAVDTALAIYRAGKGSWGKTAVVATSATFQDALSASPYAYAKHAPIFLANASSRRLDDRVVSELKKGGFTQVLITGGTAAISSDVEKQLAGITCVRKGGATAYETSSAIASWCVSQGMRAENVGVATGDDYYDALTGAAFCGKNNAALVLVSDFNRSSVTTFVRPRKASISHAFVFGGPAAVSNTTYQALVAALA